MKNERRRFPARPRHAALLLPLCVILLTGLSGKWAQATEVPFTAHTISSTADGACADVDGDGDVDVLSASLDDNTIAWYENDGGSPNTFTITHLTETTSTAKAPNDIPLSLEYAANAGSISATTGSEVLVKDIGGQIAALIDVTTGNLSLRGSVTTGQTGLSNPSNADLVFKNIGGQVVGYITAAGDMVLKGDVHNEFPFN